MTFPEEKDFPLNSPLSNLSFSVRSHSIQTNLFPPCQEYVSSLEEELHSEIEKIKITPELPEKWTYPDIQPYLLEEAKRRGIGVLAVSHSEGVLESPRPLSEHASSSIWDLRTAPGAARSSVPGSILYSPKPDGHPAGGKTYFLSLRKGNPADFK